MDVFAQAERMMTMDQATWQRHASPWSVWTRFFTCVPLISLAVWSRVWLGWYAALPVALAMLWTWWNPRAFPPPRSTDNWASKGTFGERIFRNRRMNPTWTARTGSGRSRGCNTSVVPAPSTRPSSTARSPRA